MAMQTATPKNKKAITTPTAPAAPKREFSDRVLDWIKAHRQLTSWIGAIVVIAIVLIVWQLATRRRAEEIASRELAGARFAYENQNMPLAASELARVIADYSGTNAASEGRLLLANVRLLQGQPQQAISDLQEFAPDAGKAYKAQAYGLLGAAYENLGRFREAGDAYEKGSAAAPLDFMKAQMLSDAGRAWTNAADTAKAVADYQRIVKEFSKQGNVTEAKVRLAELTKGTAS